MSESQITPEVFTTDYVGEPGGRTFFIQARDEAGTSTFLVEKQQVALLAEKLREVLVLIDQTDTVRSAPPARDPALDLAEPVQPVWRVGNMGLGYEEERDVVVVVLEEARAEEEDEAQAVQEHDSAQILLRRDQVRAFILHAAAIVGEGRPVCQLCGLPMDPAGHRCPASNGHHPVVV